MNGCTRSETERAAPPPAAEGTPAPAATSGAAAPAVPLAADLDVVKKGQGPVLTTVDEFYKVGPGPSSSHTIGPMRITYDFYQRATKLPADKLAKATKLQVNLFGSLSATGKGHGTERAALAGLIEEDERADHAPPGMGQRAADLDFASDELDLIAPLARSAHRSGDWSQRRVIATHGIQRDSDHTAKALFTNV